MSITSLLFVAFVFATLILYYIVPKRFQWVILLLASIGFYLSLDVRGFIFVLVTASSIYGATRWMDKISRTQKAYIKENKTTLTKEEKSEYKSRNKKKRKRIMIWTLILNIGILCVVKYANFAVEYFNSFTNILGLSVNVGKVNILVPLGISFYTFQSVGYLVDVYWEKVEAQKNYLKALLFVSFFPQITQGPISEYGQLSGELFKEHKFTYENYSRGFQRMIWGFMKKMVIADTLAPYIKDIFANYSKYTGITCFIGILAYSVQIYADFSGYMDIMCGLCETLDIRLAENFNRPYFSKSIAEYWRRWHITLGTWFKTYIYYPIGVSRWAQKLGKKTSDKFGKHVGQAVPATVALLLVWFTTGLWHGASGAYILWGLLNGIIIIFSMWMEPLYDKCKSKLKINESAWFWRAFQVIRTFLLVSFIKVLPELSSLSDGLGLWKQVFSNITIPKTVEALVPALKNEDRIQLIIVIALIIVLFISSLLQRRKPIRDYFNKLPLAVRLIFIIVMVYLILVIGLVHINTGGFMYAKF